MNVKELITELQKYDPDTEVLITDGVEGYCYRGDYFISLYVDDRMYVDIGIGYCMENGV